MDNIREILMAQIESYEKMISDNQDRMINLHEQINYYERTNARHLDKIREITRKLTGLEIK